MPKFIDPEQRKTVIADALFDVLRDGGFESVTLSNVADRAGLAIGSIRHFLGSRRELIGFAFDTMVDRIHTRVTARVESMSVFLERGELSAEQRLAATVDVLCELLPLDHVRRDEAIVWVEFETAARTDPSLAARSARAASGTSRLVEKILTRAKQSGALTSSVDLLRETARLSALIDGLSLRCALHPELLEQDLARQVLTAHFRGLRL